MAEHGFLMGNSWWDAGKSWHFDGRFSCAKNMPPILDLFFGDSHFGNDGRLADSISETHLSLKTAA